MRDGESLQSRGDLGSPSTPGLAYKSLAREYGGNTACTRVQVHASAGDTLVGVGLMELSARNRAGSTFRATVSRSLHDAEIRKSIIAE